MAGGSDAPIETCSPFTGMYDAIFRTDRNCPIGKELSAVSGDDVFRPSERLSFSQALWLYTVGAAYACKSEHVLGQVEEGFAGDFVLVDPAVLDTHSLLRDLAPDVVVVGGMLKHACDGLIDGKGTWQRMRVYYPRHQAGEVDSDEMQVAAARHRSKRTRRAPPRLGGDYVPGKNGPAGLLSRRGAAQCVFPPARTHVQEQRANARIGVRARGTLPAEGFFCACWLRGKMCSQPPRHGENGYNTNSGDSSSEVEASNAMYCQPVSTNKKP